MSVLAASTFIGKRLIPDHVPDFGLCDVRPRRRNECGSGLRLTARFRSMPYGAATVNAVERFPVGVA